MEFYIFPAVISYSTSPLATFPTDRHVFAFARHLLYLHRNRLSAYSPIYGGEHRDTIFNLSSNNALPPLSLFLFLSLLKIKSIALLYPRLSLSLSLSSIRIAFDFNSCIYIYICIIRKKEISFLCRRGKGVSRVLTKGRPFLSV